ncbi:hypothetical protein BH09BAC1_BH09BAC1_17370 [soil metagenome]
MYIKADIKRIVDDIDDERFLQSVKAMLETYQNQEAPVVYTVFGEPLNDTQYQQHIAQILKEVRAGDVISQEDLEKEAENW